MSTDSGTDSARTPSITLTENPDGRWTARDLEADVSAQGETRDAALENLDAVVAALRGEAGREPTAEELREVGIDPEADVGGELPDGLE